MPETFKNGDKAVYRGAEVTVQFGPAPDPSTDDAPWLYGAITEHGDPVLIPAGGLRRPEPTPVYSLGQRIRTGTYEFTLEAGPFAARLGTGVFWVGTDEDGKSTTITDGCGEAVTPPVTYWLDGEGDVWARVGDDKYQAHKVDDSYTQPPRVERDRGLIEVTYDAPLRQCESDGSPLTPRVGDRVRITSAVWDSSVGKEGRLEEIQDNEYWVVVEGRPLFASGVEVISRG